MNHLVTTTSIPMPAITRGEVVDLIAELERRFPCRWFSRNIVPMAVHTTIIEPLRKALLCGHVEDLDAIVRVTRCDHYDDVGTDYSFLHDLGTRIQVIALEARHRISHDGAPFPP